MFLRLSPKRIFLTSGPILPMTTRKAADRVERAIYDACAFVAEAPMRGHSRPDLTTRSLRFWTLTRYPNYAVVYRPETTPLEIIAVMHGREISGAF
jgi:plasmid stabilization system protein ParE